MLDIDLLRTRETSNMNIDELFEIHGDAAYWLEDQGNMERFGYPSPSDPDGASAWFCKDCGQEIEDTFDGCENCSASA